MEDFDQERLVEFYQKRLVELDQERLVEFYQKRLVELDQERLGEFYQKRLVELDQERLVEFYQKRPVELDQERLVEFDKEVLLEFDWERLMEFEKDILMMFAHLSFLGSFRGLEDGSEVLIFCNQKFFTKRSFMRAHVPCRYFLFSGMAYNVILSQLITGEIFLQSFRFI